MHAYKYATMFLMVLIAFNITYASSEETYNIDSYTIEVTPLYGNIAAESISIVFTTFQDDVEIRLDYSSYLEDLMVNLDGADSYSYIESGPIYHLDFIFPEQGTHSVEMCFQTSEFSDVEDGKMVYSPTFSFPVSPDYFKCRLILQEDMSVSHPMVPPPDSVYANGSSIIVEWENISSQSSFYILCAINKPHDGSSSYYLALLIIPGAFIGYLMGRKGKSKEDPVQPNFKTDEAKVWGLLESGVQTHAELVNGTGYSKSKITRILQEMEDRGVIRREKYKKRNIIYIQKEGNK